MRQHGTIPDSKPLYRLYDGGGEELGYREMLDSCVRADVVLFGDLTITRWSTGCSWN